MFQNLKDAEKALEELDKFEFFEKQIRVEFAKEVSHIVMADQGFFNAK